MVEYGNGSGSIGNSPHIILVDDEPRSLLSFSTQLKAAGLTSVTTIEDSRRVMPFLEIHGNRVAVVVLDLAMPFLPGQELLVEIRQQYPEIPVIIMTATTELDTAVECMKNGAMDYLVKPVEKSRFLSSVRRALEIRQLKHEVSRLKKHLLSDRLVNPDAFAHLITCSAKMLTIFKYIEAIAGSPHPVMITGETGVGKELAARALHDCGKPGKEFIAVNVAGLDDTMFSDTLFGHRRGAFTGADSNREGLIARASGGTVFLDEIGDLNAQSQVKLLRLIQENEYYPLGSDIPVKSGAHIIVATNRDLPGLMDQGTFRRDIYFRLCSHLIHIPPLRERKNDIPLLLEHFIRKAAKKLDKKVPATPVHLEALLASYDFPGNIRQLESMVYDAVSRHKSGTLSLDSFKRVIGSRTRDPSTTASGHTVDSEVMQPLEQIFGRFPTLKEMEKFMTDRALERAGGNQGAAASLLGLTRQALNKRLNRRK